MLTKFKQWFAAEASPLLLGRAMRLPEWDAPLEEVVHAWHILKHVAEAIEKRMGALRERLMEEAEQDGDLTEKQGYRLLIEEEEVLKERRVGKLPEEAPLREVLKKKKIPVLDALSEQKSYVVDPSKLTALISLGKLTEKEIEDLKKVNWALKVVPSEDIAGVLHLYDEMAPANETKSKVVVETRKRPKAAAGGARRSR